MKIMQSGKTAIFPAIQDVRQLQFNLPNSHQLSVFALNSELYLQVVTLKEATITYGVLYVKGIEHIEISELAACSISYFLEGEKFEVNGNSFGISQIAVANRSVDKYLVVLNSGYYSFLTIELRDKFYEQIKHGYDFLGNDLKNRARSVINMQIQGAIATLLTVQEHGKLGIIHFQAATIMLIMQTLRHFQLRFELGKRLSTIPPNVDIDTLSEVARYIDKNLERKITIDNICKEFTMSRTKLIDSFKVLYGETLHEFITKRKMEQAKHLLSAGITLDETCQRVGVGEKSNFIRIFKKTYGITPASFCRNLK